MRKIIRTEQSIQLKPHDYHGAGLTKFYHIKFFLGKIHSTSQITWTSEFWGVSSGELCLVRALSLQNSQIAHAWICSVSWMGGQKKRKLTGNLVFLRLLENWYNLLAHSLFITWQKENIANLLLKNFWPDFVEGFEDKDVDNVCERHGIQLGMGLGCYSACDKKSPERSFCCKESDLVLSILSPGCRQLPMKDYFTGASQNVSFLLGSASPERLG